MKHRATTPTPGLRKYVSGVMAPALPACGLLVVCASLLASCASWPRAAATPRALFELQTPDATHPLHLAISPDGREVVAWASVGNGLALWSRPLASATSQLLSGTLNLSSVATGFPFWSPDSAHIAFFGNGSLQVIPRTGGTARPLTDAPHSHGGTWSKRGIIVYAPTSDGPLYRIPASGGTAMPASALDASRWETSHRHPFFLPDGRHFIYLAVSSREEYSGIWLGSLDSPGRTFLAASSRKAQFAPPGTLLYIQNRVLLARPFDVRRRKLAGAPIPLALSVAENPGNNVASFSVSTNSVLAYRTAAESPPRQVGPITIIMNWPVPASACLCGPRGE